MIHVNRKTTRAFPSYFVFFLSMTERPEWFSDWIHVSNTYGYVTKTFLCRVSSLLICYGLNISGSKTIHWYLHFIDAILRYLVIMWILKSMYNKFYGDRFMSVFLNGESKHFEFWYEYFEKSKRIKILNESFAVSCAYCCEIYRYM